MKQKRLTTHSARLAMASIATSAWLFITPFQTAAQPPLTHALIHIRNESNAKATLYYRWGDRPWKKYIIERERAAYFNWRYDGTDRRSPAFTVRIDVDADAGAHCVEHVLSRGASPDPDSSRYGHHFVIKQLQGTSTRYIDATTQGARVNVTDKSCSWPNV